MTVSDAASDSSVIELVPDVDDADPLAIDEDLRLVEALLFASATAVTERTIAERLGDSADVTSILGRLKELYKGRGVELTRAGNRWFFRTAPDLGDRLKLEKMVPRKLSRAGTETLAIIAYHQPVTRAEIEEIRGVVISKGTIDILLEEGWIKPKGRRHTPGRPVTWGTSDAFLDHFGLESLNDLPGIDELKAAGLLDSRQGLAAYNARAEEGETLLFDTDESDEALDPLEDEDSLSTDAAVAETFAEDSEPENGINPDDDSPEQDGSPDALAEEDADSADADLDEEEAQEEPADREILS
jgi:segregation and condensation protein B